MSSFRFSQKARVDIDNIWDYTSENWNTDQADTYVRRITRVCEDLATGLLAGIDARSTRPGYFKHFVGSHVVYFRYVHEDIEIVRILHQRMDGSRHL